jgi:hypothetical protein
MKKLLVCLAVVALVMIVSASPAQARGRRGSHSQVQIVSYAPAAYVAPVYAAPMYVAPPYVAPVYAAPVITTTYVVPTVQTVYRVGRRGR